MAAWAVGWIPYVGWLRAADHGIGYTFGESIVRSIVFNIADWLGGNVSFGEGLVNVGIETIAPSSTWESPNWNFCYPPSADVHRIPAAAADLSLSTLAAPDRNAVALRAENAGAVRGLTEAITPARPPRRRFVGHDCSRTGSEAFGDLLGDPLSPPDQAKTSEVSTIPSIVNTPFTPLKDLRRNLDGADQQKQVLCPR